MSATVGTVALVNTTTPLTCKTAADCAADSRIIDLVGYGSAVVRETAPAAATSNTTSAARTALTDTDNNANDFSVGAPSPQSSSDTPPPPPLPVRIHDIQGDGHLSPLAGTMVQAPGIVTAVRAFGSARGFWMQDAAPDGDAATSEGIFVFTASSTPNVQPGDAVTVTGTVTEFYPDASPADSVMLSTTELTSATWVTATTGNPLPAAEPLGTGHGPDARTPANRAGRSSPSPSNRRRTPSTSSSLVKACACR